MARHYLINISGTGPGGPTSIYLTTDGLVGGVRCKTRVPEADTLLTPATGNTTTASDGSPFTEKPLTAGKGRPFTIEIPNCKIPVYDDLKELIDYVVDQNADLQVVFSGGDTDDIDVQATPNFAPVPIGIAREKAFSPGIIKNVTLRFITTAFN